MFKAFRKYSPKMKAPLRKTGNLHSASHNGYFIL
uniref:Uncharacterized protein n=1 Tax=Anguilla anguilla TaxID=7936 RepID=A0A0E9QV37_ANGAN